VEEISEDLEVFRDDPCSILVSSVSFQAWGIKR